MSSFSIFGGGGGGGTGLEGGGGGVCLIIFIFACFGGGGGGGGGGTGATVIAGGAGGGGGGGAFLVCANKKELMKRAVPAARICFFITWFSIEIHYEMVSIKRAGLFGKFLTNGHSSGLAVPVIHTGVEILTVIFAALPYFCG